MGKPGQIIPHHLIANRDKYDRLIAERFACVSAKAVNQMRRALRRALGRRSNGFWTDILAPHLLLDATGQHIDQIDIAGASAFSLTYRPIYLPIADTVRTKGRNHERAVWASEAEPALVQGQISVFANTLRIGSQKEDGEWEKPSDRVVGAPYTVFTLEYDAPSGWDRDRRLRFLDTQLGWFRQSGSNDLDRPIRAVWDWAVKFSDFRGICANWSGNKSVHIHLVFDTSAIMREFPALRDQFRSAYTRLWTQMAAELAQVFPQDIEPDSALRLPEQYRKVPNGVQTIEPGKGGPKHLLGIPAGTRVPLLCVWEKLLTRAPTGADRAFVNEGVLKQAAVSSRRPKSAGYRRESRIGDMTPAEHEYCSEQFDALIAKKVGPGGFPRGAGLHKESVWVGRLFANEFDLNPSTIILEDNNRAFVQGGRQPDRLIALEMPLQFHVRQWRRDYARTCGTRSSSIAEHSLEALDQKPDEHQFSEAAVSSEAAREALGELLPRLLEVHKRILIRAAEGLGKTTAVAGCLPELTRRLTTAAIEGIPAEDRLRRDVELRRPSALAFSSYKLAEEKAEEFNGSAAGRWLRGIVLPSFSRMYKDSREALAVEEEITTTWAAEHGYDSLADAIRKRQPEVWEEMARRHGQAFDCPKGFGARRKRIVYFLVHQVLHQFTSNLLSGAFLHPQFFSTEPRDYWQLRDEMRLQVALHDEVPLESIVAIHRADQVEWCLDLFEQVPEVWGDPEVGLVEKYRTFEAKRAGATIPVTFDQVLEILRTGYQRSDQTEVAECERYGNGLLYAGTHGRRWYARKRNWSDGLAQSMIMLTTEALPTEMVRQLRPDEAALEVFDLRTPAIRAGTVQVQLKPSCSSEHATVIVDQIRAKVGDSELQVITNRAADAESTSTHAGVRGSNQFAGQNLAQTAFYKSPEEYERLQIINRLFGLNAAIRLRHVDEINQTAGRNLGFRHDGKVEHHLVMGWSLYGEIESVLYTECRYGLTLVEDADQRRKNKSVEQRHAVRGARQTEEQIDALVGEQDWIEATSGSDLAQNEVGVQRDTANRGAPVEPASTVVGVAGG